MHINVHKVQKYVHINVYIGLYLCICAVLECAYTHKSKPKRRGEMDKECMANMSI